MASGTLWVRRVPEILRSSISMHPLGTRPLPRGRIVRSGYPIIPLPLYYVNSEGDEIDDSPSLLSGRSDGTLDDPHANNITDAPSNLLENPLANISTSFGGLGDSLDFSFDADVEIPQDASFQNLPPLTDVGLAAWQPGPVVLPANGSDLLDFINFDPPAGHLPVPNYDTNNTVCFPPGCLTEPLVLLRSPSIPAIPPATGNCQNRLVPILPKMPCAPSKSSSMLPLSQASGGEVCRATGAQHAPDKPFAQKRKRKGRGGIPPTLNCDSVPINMALQEVSTPKSGKERRPYAKKTCLRCQAQKQKVCDKINFRTAGY